MDPLQVHKNGKIFLLLDTEIGAVGHIASMAILPAGALVIFFKFNTIRLSNKSYVFMNWIRFQIAMPTCLH